MIDSEQDFYDEYGKKWLSSERHEEEKLAAESLLSG